MHCFTIFFENNMFFLSDAFKLIFLTIKVGKDNDVLLMKNTHRLNRQL